MKFEEVCVGDLEAFGEQCGHVHSLEARFLFLRWLALLLGLAYRFCADFKRFFVKSEFQCGHWHLPLRPSWEVGSRGTPHRLGAWSSCDIYGGLFVFSLFIKLEFDGDGRGGRPHHKKWGTEQMVVINHTLFLTSGWEG